ncbi:MAG: hypothetical protein GTN81_12380 [Proteobacteria bacterium]|nr:hypothetical protein [Pseudomonadota bacterium]
MVEKLDIPRLPHVSLKNKRPSEIREIVGKILLTKGTTQGELSGDSIAGKKDVVEELRARSGTDQGENDYPR